MNVTEIQLTGTMDKKTGRPIAVASISKNRKGDYLTVQIDSGSPLTPDIREHKVEIDNEDDLFSMAQCLHERLEGRKGSNSEIHEYYRLLQYFIQ